MKKTTYILSRSILSRSILSRSTLFIILAVVVGLAIGWYIRRCQRMEGFSKDQTLILLGDSILQNKQYVEPGHSVEDILKKSLKKVKNYALDEATIKTVYLELNQIPKKFNVETTTIILSIGGNDLIEKKAVASVLKECQALITKIKQTFPACKIAMVNLYCPHKYKDNILITSMINSWNTALAEAGSLPIIDINPLLTDATDFNSKIEPSETGSAKIADAILAHI